MSDLFDSSSGKKEPLAARMRPRNLDEYIGQEHIVGKGRLLRRAIAADQLSSVIFYGPPGTGKTTLARVIANHTKSNFLTLNAVLTGVADIRTAIKNADDYFKLYGKRTILFVDEVHRWNKAQQDALLPWVENGTIILIGATTENPFFEVNKALVSRSRVFQLKALTQEDLLKAAKFALDDKDRGYGKWKVQFEEGALEHLVETANGDARSLLNALELAVETTPEKWPPALGENIFISKEACEESIQKKVVLYDRDGDYHYDIISAFIKSLRGRDPDAAMYWLARMVRAGEDPHFIFRRMLISACEDTGLADPYAISVVESCANAFDRIGLPEGRYHLAHAALYLATAPKSNSSMAFFDALASVEKEDAEVPNHLRDSSRDAEGFGHGDGYLYPHAYRDHWVAQQYLPDSLVGRVFYTPTEQGYEAKIREDVLSRRELQVAAILENQVQTGGNGANCGMHPLPHFADDFSNPIGEWWVNQNFKMNTTKKDENLTFTPKDDGKESSLDRADKAWRARLDSNRAEILSSIRNAMIQLADLKRHSRSLIWNADDGLLLWEILRKTPEGITCGICRSGQGKQILEQYGRTLEDLDKPILEISQSSFLENFLNELELFKKKEIEFDKVFLRDPFFNLESIEKFSEIARNSGNVEFIISQRIPSRGQRISDLIMNVTSTGSMTASSTSVNENASSMSVSATSVNESAMSEVLVSMKEAEEEFFTDSSNPLFNWDENSVCKIFGEEKVQKASTVLMEKRRISSIEIERWFDSENSAYGKAISSKIGKDNFNKIKEILLSECNKRIFKWKTEICFMKIGI